MAAVCDVKILKTKGREIFKMAAACNVIILKWREKLVLVYAARWQLCEKNGGK
jgi:hypothetical protein